MYSKKYILVFTIILSVLLPLNAQIVSTTPAPRTHSESTTTNDNYFKVFGGWVGSWGSVESYKNYIKPHIDFASSPYGGLSYTYSYTNSIKLEPGVRYIDKSATTHYNDDYYSMGKIVKKNLYIYLIDTFLKLKIHHNQIPIEAYLGYSGAYAVNGEKGNWMIAPNFASSLLFGIDYVLPLDFLPNRIIIGIEYSHGLAEYGWRYNPFRISQKSLLLSTGLLF